MNVLKNSQVVANELLLSFKNALGVGRFVKHEYDERFGRAGAKIGDKIDLRDPVRFTVGDGEEITPQSIEEKLRTLTLNQRKHVAWEYTTKEDTLSVDQWMKRYGNWAAMQLANEVDRIGMLLAAQGTGLTVGTIATAVAAFRSFGDTKAKIEDYAAPANDDMLMFVNPATQVDAYDLAKALFQSQVQIKRQYEDGNMGRANGFNWHMTQNVRRHTVGALGGTPLVAGAAQTGASIATDGWTASITGVLKKGDSITFAGVNGVNQITKEDLGFLQQFVVTADVNSDGAGLATIPIDPPITVAGAYQTVTQSPADNAVILIFGDASAHANKISAQNIGMHPEAMVLGMAPLTVPKGLDFAGAQMDPDTGTSIRFLRDYEIKTDKLITRVDVLFGWVLTHPDWIVRLLAA